MKRWITRFGLVRAPGLSILLVVVPFISALRWLGTGQIRAPASGEARGTM